MVGIIQNSNKDCIEKIIGNTFNAIQDAYCYQAENALELDNLNRQKLSRVVFPQKRDGTKRISEQELRLVFVEQLNKAIYEGWDVYYSVETPTRDTYSGLSNGETPKQDEKGRSGEFDLVIFNNRLERIALIEFKANNASDNEHMKDFVKLNNPIEGDALRYFIEVIKSYDNGTLSNLHNKTEGYERMFRCWSLGEGKELTTEVCDATIKK